MVWKKVTAIFGRVAGNAEKFVPLPLKHAWWGWRIRRMQNKENRLASIVEDNNSSISSMRSDLQQWHGLTPREINDLVNDSQSQKATKIFSRFKKSAITNMTVTVYLIKKLLEQRTRAELALKKTTENKREYIKKVSQKV